MEIKDEDQYCSQCMHGVSQEALSTLMTLYQPLVGSDAVLIYLTLAAEAESKHGQDSFQRVFALTGIPAATFAKACAKLEEYMLLRTYIKEEGNRNCYIYLLNLPLSAKDFAENGFYMSRYQKIMGQGQTEISLTKAMGGMVSLQGYKDVTHAVKNLKQEDYDRTIAYAEVKPQYVFSTEDAAINFDYERFLAKCTALVFPIELRSQENMALIGRLATVYGLSPERMIILTKECVRLSTMEFDSEKLKIKAARAVSDAAAGNDPYEISPVSFLQSKQNGVPVSYTDKKLVERLSTEMHFSNTVINIMLEYILQVSQNRLSPKFVDMVAGEWARDGIATKEQALLETKKQLKTVSRNRAHVKIEMPEYMKKQKAEGIQEDPQASQEQIEQLKEMQKKIKERHTYGKG
ncbi:MAG: DnaD domain protein [Solobacterium sp.]|jgi:replication initiation and membrane attachment protein DnaB|nr:DnaD domain protein [Solobacterium sp.]MCH4204936.1 DnaD domain protein [Solobacterium sp.]MCH4226328.1 DnaD domain protein [Solobacterium sp.]MCH4281729.1 DnaD domain protein [Solobacterium sp.]